MLPIRASVLYVFAILVMAGGVSESAAQPEPAGAPSVLFDSTGAFFMQPVWAPDGDRLAVTGPGHGGIWLINNDGSNAWQITDDPAAGFGMKWSPDGTALLSRVTRYENRRRLNAVAVFETQGEQQMLTDYRSQMPALPRWSPDGQRVLLPGSGTLEVLETGRPAVPTTQENVLYATGRSIHAARPETGDTRNVGALEEGRVLNVTPSPNGQKVAFEVMGGPLYVMDADGMNRVELGDGHRPSWSPDSQWIVYTRTDDDGHRFTSSELHAVRADGNSHVQLTSTPNRLEMNPSWSPEGNTIAFDDNEGRIWLLPLSY